MSMSMHVAAVKPADDKYQAMAAVYHACVAANVAIPKDVDEFFNGEAPDPTGTRVSLGFGGAGETFYQAHGSAEPWRDKHASGVQIDITKLPAGTRFVRFWWSW